MDGPLRAVLGEAQGVSEGTAGGSVSSPMMVHCLFLTGGLDRSVSPPTGERLSSFPVSNLCRRYSQLYLRRGAWSSVAWEFPATVLQEGGTFQGLGGAGVGGGWRRCGGFQGLLFGQSSAAFGGADHRRRHGGLGRVQRRFVERELRGAGLVAPFSVVMQLLDVLALSSPGNFGLFFEFLFWQTLVLVF